MQSVYIADPVLCQLIPQHRQPPQLRIHIFRKIGHAVVSVFHQIGNQLRILPVVLQLAVILQFLCLLHRIRIDLHNADAVCDHPCCQAEPVVPCRLQTQYDLFLVMLCRDLHRPRFCALKSLCVVAEWECVLTEFPPSGVDCSHVVGFTADVTSNDQHVVTDKCEFCVLVELDTNLQIPPGR